MAKTLVTDTDISLSSLHQQLLIKPAASNDSTTVVQIQNSAGTVVLNVDTTNNRVGIGTNSPTHALQVVGQINISDSNSYIWGAGTSYISGSSVSNFITFNTAVTERMRITSAGNVGIGTATPAQKLEVNGIGRFTGTGAFSIGDEAGALRITSNNASPQPFGLFSATNNYTGIRVGAISVGTSYGASDAPAAGMIVQGNVGIGTTAPNVKLDVLSGTVNTAADSLTASTMTVTGPNVVFGAGANNAGVLNVETNTALGIDVGGSIGFGGRYTGTAQAQWALIKGAKENATDGDYASYLAFGTRIMGGQVTERVRINSTGNVGIGISSPTAKLHVAGGKILLDNTQGIQIKDAAGTARTVVQVDGGDNLYLDSAAAGGDLFFRASGNDKLTIKATSGNVGIGTTTPTSKLAVNGNVAIGLPSSITGNYGQLEVRRASSDNRVTAGFTTDTNYQTMGWLPGTDFRVGFEYSGQYHQFKVHTGAGAVTDALYIQTTTGNVGIGTITPGNKLAIVGSGAAIRITGTNDTSAVYTQFNSSANTGLGYVGVEGSTAGATLTNTLAYATFISAGSSGSALQLGTPGGIRATILANGNVGIGTTAPATRLQIGNYTVGTDEKITVAAGNGYNAALGLHDYSTAYGFTIQNNGVSGYLEFLRHNNSVPGVSAMVISRTNGSVGIGVAIPTYQLEVGISAGSGTARFYDQTASTGSTLAVFRAGAGQSTNDLTKWQNNAGTALSVVTSAGWLGIGTASPAYALDVTGTIRSSAGILNTTNTFEKVFSSVVNFPNAVANQAVDIRLGNLAIGGYIEVELNSTYANQPSYGKLTKLFAIGTNPNNAIYTNESRVSDALGTLPDNVAIGDISWDATNSVYRIPISHIVSTGNQYTIKVRMFSEAGLAKPVFDAMTVSSIYTLTALSRNYVNYNGNVGIGTITPTTTLQVNGALALKSPTTVNAATYTMASTDSSLIITTTNCTITLLSAATYTGRILYIKNITAHSLTSNASNVVPLGSATAGTAILAATAGKFAMLQSDGTNWITMMSN